jgi:hypothetical protein
MRRDYKLYEDKAEYGTPEAMAGHFGMILPPTFASHDGVHVLA